MLYIKRTVNQKLLRKFATSKSATITETSQKERGTH